MSSQIKRHRGDTRRVQRTIKLSGVAQDITGWSFIMTINHEANPTTTTNQIASIIGTLTDAANGVVQFLLDAIAVATVGRFYYDIQGTDAAGQVSTWKGEFLVVQDITKGNPGERWEADGVDGARVDLLGDDFWTGWMSSVYADIDMEYATVDSRKIIQVVGTNDFQKVYMSPNGAASRIPVMPGYGHTGTFDLTFEMYVNESPAVLRLDFPNGCFQSGDTYSNINIDQNPISYYGSLWGPNNADDFISDTETSPLSFNGWTSFRVRHDFATREYWVRAWDGLLADEPDTWLMSGQSAKPTEVIWFPGAIQLRLQRTTAVGEVLGVHSFTWEQVE